MYSSLNIDIFKLHSGDVLLSQSDTLLSLLAYHFADISHLHVAVAVWATHLKPLQIVPEKCKHAKLYVWETDPIPRYDQLSQKITTGCRLVSFDDFVTPAIGIKVRQISRSYHVCQIITEQIMRRHGQPFAKERGFAVIKAAYSYYYEAIEKDIHKRHLYCTELTAEYLNSVMINNGLSEVSDLHMASPLWFGKDGPFNILFIDLEEYIIYESELSLRARIIYSALFLFVIIIVIIYYSLYHSIKENQLLNKNESSLKNSYK